jgi:hypothetical protein
MPSARSAAYRLAAAQASTVRLPTIATRAFASSSGAFARDQNMSFRRDVHGVRSAV